MREIKFRGKLISNGEWIYGSYAGVDFTRDNYKHHIRVFGEWFRVDPKTVGQFTGLKDKNGVDIYEGDTVAIFTEQQIIEGRIINKRDYTIETVMFYNGMFCCSKEDDLSIGMYSELFEVIGNIHETEDKTI